MILATRNDDRSRLSGPLSEIPMLTRRVLVALLAVERNFVVVKRDRYGDSHDDRDN